MEITQEEMSRFVGGQAEIYDNKLQKYSFRGEISSILVQNEHFIIQFSWTAQREVLWLVNNRWVKSDKIEHSGNTRGCLINEASSPHGTIVWLQNLTLKQTVILFPPTIPKLSPSEVEGLESSA